jgi:hypothetical protein
LKRRAYRSLLRADQAAATRKRILSEVADVLRRGDVAALCNRLVAKAAGVQERTVYR